MATTTVQSHATAQTQIQTTTSTPPALVVHTPPETTLFDQLPRPSQVQLQDAALELSDKMGIISHRQEVILTDLIPISMALARMSSLLCVIAQDPSLAKVTDEMREAHLKDAKRDSDESQILGEQVSKRPNAKTLASKMKNLKNEKSPYKVECRCAMALWFRVIEEQVCSEFREARENEVLSNKMQTKIVTQIAAEMDEANSLLELWMATPEERAEKEEKKKSLWTTSLPVRTGKSFVKEVMESAKETAKRWRIPGKVTFHGA